jgi:protein TonB
MENKKHIDMEVKKSEKASLENKRLLFTEIGFVVALIAIYFAFNWSSTEKEVATLETEVANVEVEDMVPITQETPPPPEAAPKIPILSDQIDVVDDNIKVDDNMFQNLEDDANSGVEIMDYIESAPEEETVEEEAIPFQLVEEKPSFNGGDANEFSKWVNSKLVYPEIAKENGVQGRVTLQFTVNADGTVSNVKVLRGVDSSLDKEAVRVVSSSPKWKPGKQRDRAVKVTYTFPVIFQLR